MSRKILVVDDNAINRKMLINTLCNEYDIIEAENGKEAVTIIGRNYKMLSAILLDIIMPEMDGYEVLRHIRGNVFMAQIPVIMVTGSEDEESRVKSLSLGANDFISKPFNPEIVKHCLHNNITLRETASILNVIQKDKLTGLLNREAFLEKAGAMIKEKQPGFYILSSFDIDNFKIINDQYGAAEGDRILREISRSVQKNMDEIGGIAGRISADNFAALFPVEKMDTDVLQRIHKKSLVSLEQQSVVFSVGRYVINDTALPASAAYDRAYIAKQSVKGRYDKHLAYFDEAMLERLIRDQQIISEMETALASQQFEVWFQPQYNHESGALIGSEALARWRHPQKGIVSPAIFIPLFEQNGFIYELDKFVWRKVCSYLRKWIDEGLSPLPVSVNISRYDIFRPDLIEVITGLIKEFDLSVNLLHLEITESAFSKSTKQIVNIVKQLSNLGLTIEIDDFGSGYSSLNTLKSVPAQVVKLDMRFIEDDDYDQRGGNILESIVRMTKWLGMSVIAEGVETLNQGDFLKSIGCCHVQGYLYARPMPVEDFELHCKEAVKERRLQALETVENLNNDVFWNPKSIDTLIFNSYVGSACIFEYGDGNLEVLRVTDKYVEMLGGTLSIDDVLKISFMEHLDENGKSSVNGAIEESSKSKRGVSCEYLLIDLPHCPHETYLRSTLRVIASIGDRCLVYCLSENITAQRISERKERRTAKQLQVVMDNINCGITAVTFSNDYKSASFLFANNKYYELLGYTKEQYSSEIGEGILKTIYADDSERIQGIFAKAFATGVPTSMEYRALRRDGGVIWLRSFVSATTFEGIDGRVQLCTYADVTAEKHAAQELLDNLPVGAALYEYSTVGEKLIPIHRNKRYWELVGRSSANDGDFSVSDSIHPDDWVKIESEIKAAILQKRDATCDIRLRCSGSSYSPFHILGRIVPKSDDKFSVYTTLTPISDEAISIKEMLPVALMAVMASSNDLSFVKDKNLRYICCSHAFAKMAGFESEKDIIGKTDFDFFSKELASKYVSDDKMLMESKASIVDIVESLPSEDGRNRLSKTSKYLLYDSQGNIVGIYGTGRDVTKAREAESQQRFLINSIPGGVATYEGLESNLESIKLKYFSDGFCEMFGYTRDEYEKLGKKNPLGLVDKEFLPEFIAQIELLVKSGKPLDYIYSAHTKDGSKRWIHIKAVMGDLLDDSKTMTANVVLFDVTDRQNTLEQLRISEEENRLAIALSKNIVCRFNVKTRTLSLSPSVKPIFEIPATIENIPYSEIDSGRVSPETATAYASFYESIFQGNKSGDVTYQRRSTIGWRWIEAHFATIFSSDGKPASAVISFVDVTDSFEKDAAYTKWQQSLRSNNPKSYSLFKCNVSAKTSFTSAEGELMELPHKYEYFNFNSYFEQYAYECVYGDDAKQFSDFMNVDSLLANHKSGKNIVSVEYRERRPHGAFRWLRLTADMVKYPLASDVEAYLLYEDIDEAKRAELLTIERAETDPLTGVLNRTTFAEKVDGLIHSSRSGAVHALLMLDIDGFKNVNDAFGHSAGDSVLIDIANLLRTVVRKDDLLARLGGDEFMIFMNDVPSSRTVTTMARRICEHSRRSFSDEVKISGSLGIAVCPQDGSSFDVLYRKADETLYYVKDSGRNSFAFYHDGMKAEIADQSNEESGNCSNSGKIVGKAGVTERSNFYEIQPKKASLYRTVLDKMGIAVAEIDWKNRKYTYSDSMSKLIAGNFNDRMLWQILLSDLSADALTVKEMQQYVHGMADDRCFTDGSMNVRLKIPSGKLHSFKVDFYKEANEYGLTEKIFLTFKDTEGEG